MELIQVQQAAAETDPMTGLLNKESTKAEIGAMCCNTRGVLMRIDLDSFSLVNDLYGMSTGDRVLGEFARIIRSAIRANDIVGRMGEDEFVAFCQNISDESIIDEKIKYINEELLPAAREILGDNMNVPLGISAGAVLVPEEGTRLDALLEKAGKALENAKQNGKHTYSLYTGDSQKTAEKALPVSDIEADMQLLSEKNRTSGAFTLNEDDFKLIYRFLCRVEENYRVGNHFIVFNISPDNSEESEIPEDISNRFFDCIRESLRGSDVVSKNGNSIVRVLLLEAETVNTSVVIRRILENWKRIDIEEEYIVTYEMEMVRV